MTDARPSIRFWGVRGSYPSATQSTVRYGGNTSCVEVRLGGEIFVLDAGTGIRALGKSISDPDRPIHLLVSHTHWDHVMGLPFFTPLYAPGNELHVYTLQRHRASVRDVFAALWSEPLFPVRFAELATEMCFHDVGAPDEFKVGAVTVRTARLNHPYLAVGYRLEHRGRAVAYVTDTAPFSDLLLETGAIIDRPDLSLPMPEATRATLTEMERRVLDLARGADVLIYDSQFTDEEYLARPHWGHSTPAIGLAIAKAARAGILVLFHHAPERSDQALDDLLAKTREAARGSGVEVVAAAEGLEVLLP